ncbi:FkbM family methyltransferase [Fulvivirga sedimenti]|uniref:FkbM family methyltransferase n=1 Tax=Fulvivirga sedimenti TaxID=2879465 RepID=A0A9X1HRS5_9BACT|nr:FkbM family methyltransferase [Fulvivirga sedimenti]MCA6074838.1 FkbM family methyltransferase [Fulvivirga sedimenti]MCA6076015.1 FkbM family methyltransferase [Fulvivirga sedimenti]MCA6077143.1 FkbM family methyltransferase [Fulvivirga sedimenti]
MNKNLVYDIGMCDGSDTRKYLSLGYDVVAVEADPTLVEKAKRKFSNYIKSGRLKIINVGITQERGTDTFYVNDAMPIWNSFDKEITGRDNMPYREIKITCVPFADIIEEHGVPFYLKIDIEGNDIYCVRDLKPGNLPKYVSLEADNKADLESLDALRDVGYTKFQCINQNTFTPVSVPYEMKLNPGKMNFNDRLYLQVMYNKNFFIRALRKFKGREIFKFLLNPSSNLTYQIGTSGPFGELLPNDWLTYDQVKTEFLESFRSFDERHPNSSYGFWCDFHATY